MPGAEESLLEKILKPVRINPVCLGLSIAGFGITACGLYFIENKENNIGFLILNSVTGLFMGAWFLGHHSYSYHQYVHHKSNLKKHGFDKRYAALQMQHYCDRQAFYVACVEQGYRNEVNDLIKQTPEKEKFWNWLPNF